MATHSGVLACRTPWTGEPGRLQSMGSQRVTYDLATTQLHTHTNAASETCSSESLTHTHVPPPSGTKDASVPGGRVILSATGGVTSELTRGSALPWLEPPHATHRGIDPPFRHDGRILTQPWNLSPSWAAPAPRGVFSPEMGQRCLTFPLPWGMTTTSAPLEGTLHNTRPHWTALGTALARPSVLGKSGGRRGRLGWPPVSDSELQAQRLPDTHPGGGRQPSRCWHVSDAPWAQGRICTCWCHGAGIFHQ